MKSFTLFLSALCLLALLSPAHSQGYPPVKPAKPLHNPMYSTHNYKHPGMAAAARSWQTQKGVAVKATKSDDAQLANYKNQAMPATQPVGGITVGHAPLYKLADRNYKIQRLEEPTPANDVQEYYIKPEHRKSNNTAIGD